VIPLRDNIPSKSFPFITYALIAANCYVFYLQITAGGTAGFERFIYQWAVVPSKLFSHPSAYAYTLFSATFLHGGWLHIIGNMLFLYIFGDNVEDRMGHVRFLIFYLLIGALANGTQAYMSSRSVLPLIGASGAIAGVLGSYFFYYPHSRVLTLIPLWFFSRIVEIPAFIFLGFWFVLQAITSSVSMAARMTAGHESGGVAWLAHAAGFVMGLIISPALAQKRSRFK
jgi:membrane associated rhomboid family serine protease